MRNGERSDNFLAARGRYYTGVSLCGAVEIAFFFLLVMVTSHDP